MAMTKSNALVTIMDATTTPGIEDCLSECRELVDCWEALKRAVDRSPDGYAREGFEKLTTKAVYYINQMNGNRMFGFVFNHPEDRLSVKRA